MIIYLGGGERGVSGEVGRARTPQSNDKPCDERKRARGPGPANGKAAIQQIEKLVLVDVVYI